MLATSTLLLSFSHLQNEERQLEKRQLALAFTEGLLCVWHCSGILPNLAFLTLIINRCLKWKLGFQKFEKHVQISGTRNRDTNTDLSNCKSNTVHYNKLGI